MREQALDNIEHGLHLRSAALMQCKRRCRHTLQDCVDREDLSIYRDTVGGAAQAEDCEKCIDGPPLAPLAHALHNTLDVQDGLLRPLPSVAVAHCFAISLPSNRCIFQSSELGRCRPDLAPSVTSVSSVQMKSIPLLPSQHTYRSW